MKSNTIIGGTLILVIANFISKILGAILKIPLTYILGEEGMAIYHTAFSVYVTVLVLTTSGIPFATSRYISTQKALGQEINIKKSVRIALSIMTVLGIIGSLILFFYAEFFALSMKDPKAILAIKMISPSILFVAIGCIYKSFFEAFGDMLPTAISQISESALKLVLGYFLALWLSSFSVAYAVCGSIFAITCGEFFATLILFCMYLPYSKKIDSSIYSKPTKQIFASLLKIAVPMMLVSVISSCLSLFETSIIRNRLLAINFTKETAINFLNIYSPFTDIFNNITETYKLGIDGARWLFGAYSGYAATVFNLPIGVLASFGVSILPAATKYTTIKDYTRLNDVVSGVMKILFILSLPCAVIFMLFSDDILFILFKNTASSQMLRVMAPMMIIISLSNILSAVLYASGLIGISFRNDLIATFFKLILLYILIKFPQINILGVIISSFLSDSLLLLLNSYSAKKHLKILPLPIGFVIKVLMSSLSMGIICYSIKKFITSYYTSLIISVLLSLIIYLLLLFLFGVISKAEIKKLYV